MHDFCFSTSEVEGKCASICIVLFVMCCAVSHVVSCVAFAESREGKRRQFTRSLRKADVASERLRSSLPSWRAFSDYRLSGGALDVSTIHY